MVMVLVVLTFVVFIALDYFVFSRRHAEASSPALATVESAPGPLPAVRQRMPAGIFLQPTFTWSRLGRLGEVYIGVHPMLVGLVGDACELGFRSPGEHVAKGEQLVTLSFCGRHLTVRSPIAGRVEHVNKLVTGETRWRDLEHNNGGWLYRIQPERVAEEVPRWLAGEQAAEWTRRQYGLLREYLQGAVADGHLGFVMADGGELPIGILADMDERVWAGLEDRFLAHAG
jgi:glycine cleavage system H lipoate-binding protein